MVSAPLGVLRRALFDIWRWGAAWRPEPRISPVWRHDLARPGARLNRTQELTQRLAAEILSGRLQPGVRLPTEQELSLATGVSRTVVREAVAALRADGLVITRQGLGAFVPADVQRRPFRIDPDEVKSANDVLQILELRMGLETKPPSSPPSAGRATTSRGSRPPCGLLRPKSRRGATRSTPTSRSIWRSFAASIIATFRNSSSS
jgi:DNA-binding transcriptional regulator YhcF (GntR family)